jgi:hypothetical protein
MTNQSDTDKRLSALFDLLDGVATLPKDLKSQLQDDVADIMQSSITQDDDMYKTELVSYSELYDDIELTEFSSIADVLELVYNGYRSLSDLDNVYDDNNDRYISNESVEKIITKLRENSD